MFELNAAFYSAIIIVSVLGDDGCSSKQVCIPAFQCPKILDIVYRCGDESEDFRVCCPKNVLNQTLSTPAPPSSSNVEIRIQQLFPDECGIFATDDKITNGIKAAAGQFPWMALLGYKTPGLDDLLFYCGGSIINSRYILTAAHCLDLPSVTLTTVRLGELDISTIRDDCSEDNTTCADPYVDMEVENFIKHPQWNSTVFKNDIALIRLKRKITFTEYISPICIPFASIYKKTIDIGKQYTVSGWGRTKSSNLGGSNALMYAKVYIWDMKKCEARASTQTKPLNPSSQLCANGNKSQDACKGDSGGPLVDSVLDSQGNQGSYQIGIVSFAMGATCGSVELPSVYTRVSHYTKWILDTIKP